MTTVQVVFQDQQNGEDSDAEDTPCTGATRGKLSDCSLKEYRLSQEENGCSEEKNKRDSQVSQTEKKKKNSSIRSTNELNSLVQESSRLQAIISQQLQRLDRKVSVQEEELRDYKKQIKANNVDIRDKDIEIEKLKSFMKDAECKIECLKYSIDRLNSENAALKSKLEANDATEGYWEAIANGHEVNVAESEKRLRELESELEMVQNYYLEMEENFQQIEAIRYEIVSDEEQKKPLADFVEELIEKNNVLHDELEHERQKIVEAECKMMDTEFSLKAANDMYKFQKDEKEDMEHSLKSLREYCKKLEEELEALTAERELYQGDIKNMLEQLKKTEAEVQVAEERHRESEVVSKSFQEQLAGNLETLLMLEREKNEALTMVQLKEDVIKTLQKSIDQTTNTYLKKLDKYVEDDNKPEDALQLTSSSLTDDEADGEKILSAIEDRFSVLSTEIDKKDNMIIHLMKEKEDLLSRECSKVEGEELDSEEIHERIKTLDSKVRKKQNQLEENELIINHLVTVINRYAKSDGENPVDLKAIRKKNSEPDSPGRKNFFNRLSFKNKSSRR